MPKYIAVVNQKGGVGKTTTSVNLCGAYTQTGAKTLGVDADRQHSMTDWMLACDPPAFPFAVLQMTHSNIHRKLPEISVAAGYDYVVIDCPPGGQDNAANDNISRSALLLADAVLIPLQPGPLDFYAAARLRTLLIDLSVLRPELKVMVVISRRKGTGKMGKDARRSAAAFLTDEGLAPIILDTEIYERSVIGESPAFGLAIQNYQPMTKTSREAVEKAVAEYSALAKEITSCLSPVLLNT